MTISNNEELIEVLADQPGALATLEAIGQVYPEICVLDVDGRIHKGNSVAYLIMQVTAVKRGRHYDDNTEE